MSLEAKRNNQLKSWCPSQKRRNLNQGKKLYRRWNLPVKVSQNPNLTQVILQLFPTVLVVSTRDYVLGKDTKVEAEAEIEDNLLDKEDQKVKITNEKPFKREGDQ